MEVLERCILFFEKLSLFCRRNFWEPFHRMFLGSYHIIIVPQESARSKRLTLSTLTIRILQVAGLFLIPLVSFSLYTTHSYQNAMMDEREMTAEKKEILSQQDYLVMRLARLEKEIYRSETMMGRLEDSIERRHPELTRGVGPVDPNPEDAFEKKAKAMAAPASPIKEAGKGVTASRLHQIMDQLEGRMGDLHGQIKHGFEEQKETVVFFDSFPNMLPVPGWVTSAFGYRRSPFNGRPAMHYGLDIASPTGTHILAPADGLITMAEFQGGYGRKVVIDHGFGVETIFGHASQILVKEGKKVKRGDPIARVGSSGHSTGPHLHYEVHVDGMPVDPLDYLVD